MRPILFLCAACLWVAACTKDSNSGSGGGSNGGGGGTAFALDGFVTGSGTLNADMHVAAIQPDGKIIADGSKGLYRFTKDGQVDASFAPPAILQTNIFIDNITIQPDGKILLSGFFQTDPFWHIARLNPDGTADASFKAFRLGSRVGLSYPIVSAFYPLPNGKIIATGEFTYGGGSSYGYDLIRFNADGSWDTTFQPGISVSKEGISRFIIDTDGKIIVAGGFAVTKGNIRRNDIAKFDTDGNLDPSVNFSDAADNNLLSTGMSGFILMPDKKIIMGGGGLNLLNPTSFTNNFVSRLTHTCAPDPAFTVKDDDVFPSPAMLLQGSDKILLGRADNGVVPQTAHYLFQMSEDGKIEADIPLKLDECGINQMIRESDGRILLVGLFDVGNVRYGLAHLKQQ